MDGVTAELLESTEPLAAELGRSRNLNELAGAIHGWLAPVLGNVASMIAVNRPHEESISVLPAGTIHGETIARYSKIALAAPHPASWVIRTGQPLFLADLLAHLREFSLIEADFRSNGFEATGTVPLVGSSGENIGSLSLIWSERREFDADSKPRLQRLPVSPRHSSNRFWERRRNTNWPRICSAPSCVWTSFPYPPRWRRPTTRRAASSGETGTTPSLSTRELLDSPWEMLWDQAWNRLLRWDSCVLPRQRRRWSIHDPSK